MPPEHLTIAARAGALPFPAWLQTLLKAALSSLVIWFVCDRLLQADYNPASLVTVFSSQGWVCLLAAIALLPFNLGLEAYKWRMLIAPLYPALGLRQAICAVLAGMSLGFITPNRLGEYAGRVLYLQPGHRTEAAIATYLSRLSQLVAALGGAALGVGFLLWGGQVTGTIPMLLTTGLLLAGVALSAFIVSRHSLGWLGRLLRLHRWRHTRSLVAQVTHAQSAFARTQLMHLIGLGAVRYGIFILQYFLLMRAFGYGGSFALAASVCALVFILKALVPSVAFSEMGIREGIALQVMGWLFIPEAVCFNATLGLFALNLLLPSAVGVLFLLRLRLDAPMVAPNRQPL